MSYYRKRPNSEMDPDYPTELEYGQNNQYRPMRSIPPRFPPEIRPPEHYPQYPRGPPPPRHYQNPSLRPPSCAPLPYRQPPDSHRPDYRLSQPLQNYPRPDIYRGFSPEPSFHDPRPRIPPRYENRFQEQSDYPRYPGPNVYERRSPDSVGQPYYPPDDYDNMPPEPSFHRRYPDRPPEYPPDHPGSADYQNYPSPDNYDDFPPKPSRYPRYTEPVEYDHYRKEPYPDYDLPPHETYPRSPPQPPTYQRPSSGVHPYNQNVPRFSPKKYPRHEAGNTKPADFHQNKKFDKGPDKFKKHTQPGGEKQNTYKPYQKQKSYPSNDNLKNQLKKAPESSEKPKYSSIDDSNKYTKKQDKNEQNQFKSLTQKHDSSKNDQKPHHPYIPGVNQPQQSTNPPQNVGITSNTHQQNAYAQSQPPQFPPFQNPYQMYPPPAGVPPQFNYPSSQNLPNQPEQFQSQPLQPESNTQQPFDPNYGQIPQNTYEQSHPIQLPHFQPLPNPYQMWQPYMDNQQQFTNDTTTSKPETSKTHNQSNESLASNPISDGSNKSAQNPSGQQQPPPIPPPPFPPGIYPPGFIPSQPFAPGQFPPPQFPPGQYPPNPANLPYFAQPPPPGMMMPGMVPPPSIPQPFPYAQPNPQFPQGYNPQLAQNVPMYPQPMDQASQILLAQNQQKQIAAANQAAQAKAPSPPKILKRDIGSMAIPFTDCYPSLKTVSDANAATDAKTVKEALESYGREKNKILVTITHRNSAQRDQIKIEYRKLTGKCLIDKSKPCFTDPLKHVIISLLYTGVEQDAYFLNMASSVYSSLNNGIGKNDDIVMNIICTRSSEQLKAINEIFPKMFRISLREQIERCSNGNYQKLLLKLIDNPRPNKPVDTKTATESARNIYDKSFVKIRGPENWIDELCNCSEDQLVKILTIFQEIASQPFHEFLKNYSSGDYESAVYAMSHFIHNPIEYYAALLQKSIQKNLIDGVIFVMCTRFEIDLGSIVIAYHKKFQSNLLIDLKKAFDIYHPEVSEAFGMLLGIK